MEALFSNSCSLITRKGRNIDAHYREPIDPFCRCCYAHALYDLVASDCEQSLLPSFEGCCLFPEIFESTIKHPPAWWLKALIYEFAYSVLSLGKCSPSCFLRLFSLYKSCCNWQSFIDRLATMTSMLFVYASQFYSPFDDGTHSDGAYIYWRFLHPHNYAA